MLEVKSKRRQDNFVEITNSKVNHDIEKFEYLASRYDAENYWSRIPSEYKRIRDETVWESETGLKRSNRYFDLR